MEEITKEKKVNLLFPNLCAELARLNMSKTELANEIGMAVSSIYGKFNGATDWTLEDMDAIKRALEAHGGQETSLDYLFRRAL